MNVIKDLQIFTNADTASESSAYTVPNNVSTLVLEITSATTPTFTLQVKGIVNSSNTAYTILESVNMTTSSVSNSITQVGVYMIPVDGISNIKLDITAISSGSISAYGKLGD